jgi:hypothetical protein
MSVGGERVMLRRARVIKEQTEFGEEIRPDCPLPFSESNIRKT